MAERGESSSDQQIIASFGHRWVFGKLRERRLRWVRALAGLLFMQIVIRAVPGLDSAGPRVLTVSEVTEALRRETTEALK